MSTDNNRRIKEKVIQKKRLLNNVQFEAKIQTEILTFVFQKPGNHPQIHLRKGKDEMRK